MQESNPESFKFNLDVVIHAQKKISDSFQSSETRCLSAKEYAQSTIVSEGFKGGTRGAPIMPRDAVSQTANLKPLRGDSALSVS